MKESTNNEAISNEIKKILNITDTDTSKKVSLTISISENMKKEIDAICKSIGITKSSFIIDYCIEPELKKINKRLEQSKK